MPHVAARMATRDEDVGRYQRHQPEQTLLYRIVDEYYPAPGVSVGRKYKPVFDLVIPDRVSQHLTQEQ